MTPRERKYHFGKEIQRKIKKVQAEVAARKPSKTYVHEFPGGIKIYTSRADLKLSMR
jgi:hypothetical protein